MSNGKKTNAFDTMIGFSKRQKFNEIYKCIPALCKSLVLQDVKRSDPIQIGNSRYKFFGPSFDPYRSNYLNI